MLFWQMWVIFGILLLIGAILRVGLFLKCFSVAAFICVVPALWGVDPYVQLRIFLGISLLGIALARGIRQRSLN